jgi:hypothetical protein
VPPTVPATARILAALGPRMLQLARGPLRFMTGRGGGYAANLRRMGFGEDEIARLSDGHAKATPGPHQGAARV